jgi:hypothetical protein
MLWLSMREGRVGKCGCERVSALYGGWWSVLYLLGGSRNVFVGGGSHTVAQLEA